jgi:precorrin-6Y C5,15-methyltransferase (decarboxylating)
VARPSRTLTGFLAPLRVAHASTARGGVNPTCGRLPFVSQSPIDVVGIGAGGWADLPESSRDVLRTAELVVGAARQLSLLDASVSAEQVPLPSPLLPALGGVVRTERRLAVLASGDPMFFGIGSTLIRLGVDIRVHPAPSSVSLAAARLRWPLETVDVVSVVGRPLELVHPAVQPGRRLLVLVGQMDGGDSVRVLLAGRGYGASAVTVLERLGGPDERVTSEPGYHDPLAIVAVDCVADPGTVPLPRTPGLPDAVFDHDAGQLTKREIRALALAMLAPVPGHLLWDVGAGSGSVGIEWMRTHPTSRAFAIEPREERRARIAANASALGVPGLHIVAASAPEALAGLPQPDAVFVGGGASTPGVLDACVDALPIGGRLVANGVTIETESVLAQWHARLGGTLTRIAVEHAEPIGTMSGFRPARAVTQWAWTK